MKFIFLLLLFLGSVSLAHAQMAITEIMYDLEGSDTDREWVEVENTSSDSVDFSLWRFVEEGVNHKVETVEGNAVISPGGYAVIVENFAKFKADWPQFSGSIFDSSFSLKQTGETLALRNTDLADVDTVAYSTDMGGAGDGMSLQLVAGTWRAGLPTPGAVNTASVPPSQATPPAPNAGSGTSHPPAPSTSTESKSSPILPPEKSIRAVIDTHAVAIVGAGIDLRGSAFGFENKPLENVRYLWNFGDGSTAEGEHVLHTYSFPGKYVVVLSVASGEFSATAQVTIEAHTADVHISSVVQNNVRAFALYNNQSEHLNISLWRLVEGEKMFIIPERTFILPESTVFFSEETTGLSTLVPFVLLYPNGAVVSQGVAKDRSIEGRPATIGLQTAVALEVSRNSAVESSVVKKEKPKSISAEAKHLVKKDSEKAIHTDLTIIEESVSSTTQSATVTESNTKEGSDLWAWIAGLVVLLGGASSAAVFLRKKESDKITIIE